MVICKFFLEGRCRYGNQCYNEHVLDDRYRYKSDLSTHSQHQNRHSRQSFKHNYNEYDDEYESNYRYKNDSHNQNQYSWHASNSSYDYRPSKYDAGFKSDRSQVQSYNPKMSFSSGFKSDRSQVQSYNPKTSFSFTLSKNRFDALNETKISQETTAVQSDTDINDIKEDMIAWQNGKYWPFSCYTPFKGHQSIPDFEDVSPEELRHNAYEAKKNNDFSSYVKSVTDAMSDVEKKRNLFKNPSYDTIERIKNIKNETFFQDEKKTEPFMSTPFSSNASSFSFKTAAAGSSGFGLEHLMGSSSRNAQLQGMNDTSMGDRPSFFQATVPPKKIEFSFKLASTEPKIGEKGSSLLYTPMSDLNDVEKMSFEGPVFTLGKIPIRPPPRELCF